MTKAKKPQVRNIGVEVTAPKPDANHPDKHCPFTGNLPVRGRSFTGMVIASKVPKMATVEWERRVQVPKYERYLKKRSKVVVHNPPAINAKVGDIVRIMECRPISKTKKFVIIEKVGREELVEDILEGRERAADKKKEEKKAAEAKKAAEKPKEEAPEEKKSEEKTE